MALTLGACLSNQDPTEDLFSLDLDINFEGRFTAEPFSTYKIANLKDFQRSSVNMDVSETRTRIRLAVGGLVAGAYSAHLHEKSCAEAQGGLHYLNDLTGQDNAENGFWFAFTVTKDGERVVPPEVVKQHMVRVTGDRAARSVVIHEPGDFVNPVTGKVRSRIACLDLNLDTISDYTLKSKTNFTTVLLPEAARSTVISDADQLAQGWVKAVISKGAPSAFEVKIDGLRGVNTNQGELDDYVAHLHVKSCGSEGGPGGHYLIDETQADSAQNGFWFSFKVRSDNQAVTARNVNTKHEVRLEGTMPGKSIVLHAPKSVPVIGGAKIVCADLVF